MSQATVGKWGKNLAIRLPTEIARATGLVDGERVQIETQDGDILIRRPFAHARADAQAAAEEIIGDSGNYSLGDVTIRELLDEGRRG
jgi:antitoxin component of MazEF toxin-antitoxin module